MAAIDQARLKTVVGAHLSRQNNTAALARAALCAAIDVARTSILIACQEDGFSWIEID